MHTCDHCLRLVHTYTKCQLHTHTHTHTHSKERSFVVSHNAPTPTQYVYSLFNDKKKTFIVIAIKVCTALES